MMVSDIKIIPYEDCFRDDMIFMILEAKNALGRIPGLNSDLLDINSEYIVNGDMFWLAVDGNGRVVGSVGYRSIDGTSEAIIHRLFVKCTMKNIGIGSELLHTAEKYMKSAGKTVSHVHLGSPKEQWFESYRFYPKHGYTECSPAHMKKEL